MKSLPKSRRGKPKFAHVPELYIPRIFLNAVLFDETQDGSVKNPENARRKPVEAKKWNADRNGS